ncbi:unnamed protein product [Caenorhabditis brenneri]
MQRTQSGSAEKEGGHSNTGLKRRSLSMRPTCENTSPKQVSQRARSVSSGMANQSKSSERFEIPSFFQQKEVFNMNLQTTFKILCTFHQTIFMTQDDSFIRDLALRTVLRGEEIVPSSDLIHLIDNLLLSIFHVSRNKQSRRCESSVEMWKIMDSFEMMSSKFGFSMITSVKKSWDQLRMEAIRSQMYVPGNELIKDIKYHSDKL